MIFNIKIKEVNQHAKLTANEIIPLSYLKDDEKKLRTFYWNLFSSIVC